MAQVAEAMKRSVERQELNKEVLENISSVF